MRRRTSSSSSDDSSLYSELSDASDLSGSTDTKDELTNCVLLVGFETGVLKEVCFPSVGESKIKRSIGEPKKEAAIGCLRALVTEGETATHVVAVRGTSEVVVFDVEKFEEVHCWLFGGSVLDISVSTTISECQIVTVVKTDTETECYGFGLDISDPCLLFKHSKPATVACIGQSSVYLAFADSPNPVQVDESGNVKWTAKNQPDTSLQLKSQFEVTAMAEISDHFLVCGSKQGSVRIFNPELQRRALSEIAKALPDCLGGGLSSSAIQTVQSVGESKIAISDCTGQAIVTTLENLRNAEPGNPKKFPTGRSLRGVTGTVRSVEISEEELFCISAGRYVYKFETSETRGPPAAKLFLKQRPSSLVFLRREVEEPAVPEKEERPVKRAKSGME